MAMKNRIITVQDIPITVSVADEEDYICITDPKSRVIVTQNVILLY